MKNLPTTQRSVMRLLAVMLVVVIVGTLAAPARAEAVDFFLISAAVSAAVVVLLIVVYLVIANAKGKDDDSKGPEPIKVACVESETQPRTCWAVDDPEQTVSWDSVVVVSQLQPQS